MKAAPKKAHLQSALTGLVAVAITLGLMTGSVLAHEPEYDNSKEPHESPHKAEPPKGGHPNLGEAATNPLSNLIQFQLQNQYNWENNNADGSSNTFFIQPVVPFKLPWEEVPLLITRSTLPYVSTARLDGVGRRDGIGDFTLLAIPLLNLPQGHMGGVGTSLVFPTAGSNEFVGQGKYQAGPAAAYINLTIPKWQWGILGWHQWDYADGTTGSNRAYINASFVQPLLIRHFNKGWYAGLQDVTWKYDWRDDNWTMPMGPRVGKVLKLGKQPVNVFAEVLYDPMDNDDLVSPEWSFKLNLTLLFPK